MQALLLRIATQLPPPARDLATEARIQLLVQFLMFGTVGTFGFVIDTCIVYSLRGQLGLYGAGFASYFVAVTFTWLCNRLWTFRGQGEGPAHQQWARFFAVNLVGFTLNRGTYVLMIAFVPICRQQPIFATGAGAIAGMFMNFGLSRAIVFR
ncbi:MAG TPA: GtrA family protein [Acetobacteraceae bacterium]|nr:GtrA family protein [Acetobacteraceae bacterium]